MLAPDLMMTELNVTSEKVTSSRGARSGCIDCPSRALVGRRPKQQVRASGLEPIRVRPSRCGNEVGQMPRSLPMARHMPSSHAGIFGTELKGFAPPFHVGKPIARRVRVSGRFP